MPPKSPEQKAIEKQIKEQRDAAQKAARRDHASAVVKSSKMIGDFVIYSEEAEMLLQTALNKLTDSAKYEVTVTSEELPHHLQHSIMLLCEELQMYGALTSYMDVGRMAVLTLSEAGKKYFEEKERITNMRNNSERDSIFISHRATDKNVADMIMDFLVGCGVPKEKVFCSSLPGNDVQEKISAEVKTRLKESIVNIVILSKNYYKSAYCLNEAGIIWYLDEAVAIPVGLPDVDHTDMVGFLNSDYKMRRLDDDTDVSYIYDTVRAKLDLPSVTVTAVVRETQKLQERYKSLEKANSTEETDECESSSKVPLSSEASILLLYASSDKGDGTIMNIKMLGSHGSISTAGYEFVQENTAKEAARWTGALEELENYGLIQAASYKRQVFNVTRNGYSAASQVQNQYPNVDVEKNPGEYLKEY